MAIDTTLLSFCEDCEEHGGHPRYAPPLLMETLGPAAGSGSGGNGGCFCCCCCGGGQGAIAPQALHPYAPPQGAAQYAHR